LNDNGLIPGRHDLLEARFASGDYQRFPEMAHERSVLPGNANPKAGSPKPLVHQPCQAHDGYDYHRGYAGAATKLKQSITLAVGHFSA